MNLKTTLSLLAVIALGGLAVREMRNTHPQTAGAEANGHAAGAQKKEAPVVKGPHRGRMLTDGDFALGLAIFETDVPPEFRAWFTKGGKPLAPGEVKLSVTLIRPGKILDPFVFAPEGDFLRGDHEVDEPHSFDYEITAEHAGVTHKWAYASPEMQTTIAAESAAKSGIVAEKAEAAEMHDTLPVYGQIKLNGDKIARATARFEGVVTEAKKSLGQPVSAGEVVAKVETSKTLATIEVKSPIAGTVIAREITAGETVVEGAMLYTVADLGEVWADIDIPRRDQRRVKAGQSVTLHADDGGEDFQGVIATIVPVASAESRTVVARVVVPNPQGRWKPGSFIKASVLLETSTAPVTVKASAIQTLFAFTVVFSQHGDLYQARPLELGRRSGDRVEVLKGLKAGELYVTENSFLVKADIGKAGASHDH